MSIFNPKPTCNVMDRLRLNWSRLVAARASTHREGSNLFIMRAVAASLGSRRRLTLRYSGGGGSSSGGSGGSGAAQRSVQCDDTTVSTTHVVVRQSGATRDQSQTATARNLRGRGPAAVRTGGP